MKSKFVVVLAVLLASLVVVTPAFAYTGVSGAVIDSLNLQPWQYGGDVWVIDNTNGNILATCRLDGSGNIIDGGSGDCDYGDDALSYGSVNPLRSNGDDIEVIVNFACDFSGNCSGGPNGTPGDSSDTFTESGIPILKHLGYIKTGTGPTAITLTGVSAVAGTSFLPVLVVGLALVVSLGAVIVVRKRR